MQKAIHIKNKRARFEYELLEEYTAGLVLTGTEIKSIRNSKASIAESFCEFNQNGELFTVNDASGLPILKVNDDDTVLMGSYQAPSLNTTVKLNPGTGLSTVYSLPISAYTGA
ncbi:MAG: SsrA-binding protein, partial [Flavobacteriaceae bacterium]